MRFTPSLLLAFIVAFLSTVTTAQSLHRNQNTPPQANIVYNAIYCCHLPELENLAVRSGSSGSLIIIPPMR